MTKRIYVATDYLRPAGEPLELGALLSRSAGAPLALVVVRPYRPLTPEVREGSFREALKRETESRLAESVEPLRQRGLEVTGEAVVSTSVPRGLQQVSERADAGVLVVGPTRHGPLGRLFAGTTASHLLHGASCPVAIPPRGFRAPEHGPLRIGVAYDGAAEAYVALTEAAALARTIGARPRVVAIAEPQRASSRPGCRAMTTAGSPRRVARTSSSACAEQLTRSPPTWRSSTSPRGRWRGHPGRGDARAGPAGVRFARLWSVSGRAAGQRRVSRRLIGAANCPVAVVPSGHEPALGALGAPLKLAG